MGTVLSVARATMPGQMVLRLRRVRLGPLTIQGIPPGSWRDLTPGELYQIFEAVGLPIEEAERANKGRTIQVHPVGGFRHGARTARDGGRRDGRGEDRGDGDQDGAGAPASSHGVHHAVSHRRLPSNTRV